MRSRQFRAWWISCTLAVAIAVLATSYLQSWLFGAGPSRMTDEELARVASSIELGEAFLSTTDIDAPFGFLIMDMLERRYRRLDYPEALDRFEARVARLSDSGNLASAHLWSRLGRPGTTFDDEAYAAIVVPLDKIALRALYCDALPLDSAWDEIARAGLLHSDYGRTHVGFALLLAADLECPAPLDAETREQMLRDLARMTREREADDVAIEAAVFLQHLGEGERVSDGFVNDMLAAQRDNGGWAWEPDREGGENWHTTSLAVWFLLERKRAPTYDGLVAGVVRRAP